MFPRLISLWNSSSKHFYLHWHSQGTQYAPMQQNLQEGKGTQPFSQWQEGKYWEQRTLLVIHLDLTFIFEKLTPSYQNCFACKDGKEKFLRIQVHLLPCHLPTPMTNLCQSKGTVPLLMVAPTDFPPDSVPSTGFFPFSVLLAFFPSGFSWSSSLIHSRHKSSFQAVLGIRLKRYQGSYHSGYCMPEEGF